MKRILYIILGLAAGTLVAGVALANPLYFPGGASTSTATTTPTFMSAGLSTTTTPAYDAYADSTGAAANSAVLLVQFAGSSTASQIRVNFQYSQGSDCIATPNGCDWYDDNMFVNTNASSTQTANATQINGVQFNFSSSSPEGATANNVRTKRIITVPTPTRYVRAVMSIPAGSLNGSVWGQIVPVKQDPN